MKRTVKLELILTEEQKGALLRTMEEYTKAFDAAAKWGCYNKTCSYYDMHYALYRSVRSEMPELNSSLVQSAFATAAEALKANMFHKVPKRKPYAGVRYAWPTAKAFLESGEASISSVDGRIKTQFVKYDYLKNYFDWLAKSSVLVFEPNKKTFYLFVSMEKEVTGKKTVGKVLGIDRGLNNIAVCSNNIFFDSRRINGIRGKYAHNRAELQAVGTRSAKRRLRKQSGRERRFVACENHRLTKMIANGDYDVFALEDLRNINTDQWLDKHMRGRVCRWSYKQFGDFLSYKAEALGKTVLFVDPTCTSQMCSRCGLIHRMNRQGNIFQCISCGFTLHSDLNASRNIARLGISEMSRLRANQPNVPGCEGGSSGAHNIPEPRCKS